MLARQFSDSILVIATRNAGKMKEMTSLLSPYVQEVKSSAELDVPEIAETGVTFEENATLKAVQTARFTGLPSLADDSGLVVEALGGRPGVYTADWAGPERNYAAAMQRVQDELSDNPNRRASFLCTLALAWPDGHTEIVTGEVKGALIWPPRGNGGFGYDAMFQSNGADQTFAEMDLAQKQSLSHRSAAFQCLLEYCFNP